MIASTLCGSAEMSLELKTFPKKVIDDLKNLHLFLFTVRPFSLSRSRHARTCFSCATTSLLPIMISFDMFFTPSKPLSVFSTTF